MNTIVPIYYQIKQDIKKSIVSGEFNPGDKIPSENDLSMKFNVSRLTLRQAISQLNQEGFLISKRGIGTFVTTNKDLIDSSCLEVSGFLNDLFYEVSKVKTKEVKITRLMASRRIKEKLEMDQGDKEVIQIERIRFKGSRSFAYTINYLPIEIGSKINKGELYKKPLLQIIEQDLGIPFTEAFQTIEASFASQEVAKKLGVLAGSPILFLERIMYTKGRKPVELVQSSHRGDIYKYFVRLKKIKSKQGRTWEPQKE